MGNRLLNYLRQNPEKLLSSDQIKAALGISDIELHKETLEIIGTHGLKVIGTGTKRKYGFVDVFKYGSMRDTQTNINPRGGHFVLNRSLPELR